MGTTLRGAGEFGLIERLAATLGSGPSDGPARLAIGIGDDAAAWQQERAALVATTDMLVEGIHFDLALIGWYDLGWKALAVNLSDIAAMGATPTYALVSLALRADAAVRDVEALYEGMRDLAAQSGCVVAGGDTVAARSDQVIGVAVLGGVPYEEGPTLLRRDAGRAGDTLAVTGLLGASAAGLYALQHPSSAPEEVRRVLAEAHCRPQPQLVAGQILRRAGVRCAMDVSDGLLADLGKLCAASRTGAEVRASALPMHPLAVKAYSERALAWAAGGGEDYQLLFAAAPAVMERALAALHDAGVRATAIGALRMTPGVHLVDDAGSDIVLETRGWDHFARP
jgi:thiamine-monophosphate kinase